jgi:hypothetical protein
MVTRGSSPEQAQAMEQEIASGFDKLTTKLGEAASALGQSTPDPTSEALDKARKLARGMESLQERMGEKASQGSTGSEGSKGSEGSRSQGSQGSEGSKGSEGSEGSEGSRGSEGSQGSEGSEGSRGAAGDTRGDWGGAGGWGDRRPGEFSRDDVRQFRNEIRRWRGEAQELRRLLQEGSLDPKELDAILRGLRALDDDRVYRDVAELQRLQTMVTEGLKRFEFALRRRAAADGNETVLTGADEVPEEFRTLVEQYYRSLAKTPR